MRPRRSNNPPATADDREQRYEREFRKLIVTMIAAVVCCALTMVTWHLGNEPDPSVAGSADYAARILLVKDPDGVMDDRNVLWQCPTHGVTAYDGTLALSHFPEQVYCLIYAVSTGRSAFRYVCRIGNETVLDSGADVLTPGSAGRPVAVSLQGQAPLALTFYTALPEETIALVDSARALKQALANGTVIYLTRDLTVDQLTVANACPRINLNGHRLTANTLTVRADAGVYGTLIIENGVLKVGGSVLCNGDFVASEGDGHVAVALRQLTEN